MLMKYIELPDAIFWVRQYENGSSKKYKQTTGRYDTRRACLTKFSDGFSYVFVSNYDAHEIFNMISKGVVPTEYEFLNKMKTYSFPLHYDNGKKKACEEFDIAAYPPIGNIRGGILTKNSWYLAHINGVNGTYELNGKTICLRNNKDEKEKIFPRGKLSDWKLENGNKYIRNLPVDLSDDEKKIVKAHFLRFVDPLNYFLTPKTSLERNIIYLDDNNTNIGEEPHLTLYVLNEYKKLYGNKYVDEFLKRALVPAPEVNLDPGFIIDIDYGEDFVKNAGNSKTSSSKITKKNTTLANNAIASKKPLALSAASLNTRKDILTKTGQLYTTKNKVGELFVNIIFYLNNNGLLNNGDIKMLISDQSKKVFDIGYPAIAYASKYDKLRYLKSSKFTFNGVDYVVTNEWFPKDKMLEKVVKWAKTKGL